MLSQLNIARGEIYATPLDCTIITTGCDTMTTTVGKRRRYWVLFNLVHFLEFAFNVIIRLSATTEYLNSAPGLYMYVCMILNKVEYASAGYK
ncbi:unnamed protein product [Phytomonas sp. EM1]|nr:unnamed protein product [Phytomonas sp. EM1]|eukprot:CCW64541.1 unnamed protein product [Phytomonas sp. isolate EM1]